MATLPESPRWLLLSGASREDAVRALVRAEGKRAESRALVEAEVEGMEVRRPGWAIGSWMHCSRCWPRQCVAFPPRGLRLAMRLPASTHV
jgi:hypothetical protein